MEIMEYFSKSTEYIYKEKDELNFHDDILTIKLTGSHYDIIYKVSDCRKFPKLQRYDYMDIDYVRKALNGNIEEDPKVHSRKSSRNSIENDNKPDDLPNAPEEDKCSSEGPVSPCLPLHI